MKIKLRYGFSSRSTFSGSTFSIGFAFGVLEGGSARVLLGQRKQLKRRKGVVCKEEDGLYVGTLNWKVSRGPQSPLLSSLPQLLTPHHHQHHHPRHTYTPIPLITFLPPLFPVWSRAWNLRRPLEGSVYTFCKGIDFLPPGRFWG